MSNPIEAIDCGVAWVDSTVTGMGRGPENAKTEELAIEIGEITGEAPDLMPLIKLIENHFKKLKIHHEWGQTVLLFGWQAWYSSNICSRNA